MIRRSVLAVCLLVGSGWAQDVIPIGSPRSITSPGSYQLVADVEFDATRDWAVNITANGVTLDLNGHQIKGPGGRLGIGIRVAGATGVRIQNGRIADTAFGIVIENSQNVTVTGLEIRGQGLAVSAPPPETAIMIVQSRAVVFERNNVYNTPLGVFVRGSRSWGNRISGNTITSGANGVLGICYNPAPNDPNGPRGDLVSDNLISGFNTGIQVTSSASNVFRNNTIIFRASAFESMSANDLDMDNVKVQLR
jgi:nitrous oxidase accessory protein NosD